MKIKSFFTIIIAFLLSACGHPPGPRGPRRLGPPPGGQGSMSSNGMMGNHSASSIQRTGETVTVNGRQCAVVIIRGHKCVIVNGTPVPFERLMANQGNRMTSSSVIHSRVMPSTYGAIPYGQTGYGYPQSTGGYYGTVNGQTQYGPDPRFPGVDGQGVYHAQ